MVEWGPESLLGEVNMWSSLLNLFLHCELGGGIEGEMRKDVSLMRVSETSNFALMVAPVE